MIKLFNHVFFSSNNLIIGDNYISIMTLEQFLNTIKDFDTSKKIVPVVAEELQPNELFSWMLGEIVEVSEGILYEYGDEFYTDFNDLKEAIEIRDDILESENPEEFNSIIHTFKKEEVILLKIGI